MKTYEQYQELLAEAIMTHDEETIKSAAKAKKSITIRVEHNGEVYQNEFDASRAFIAVAVDEEGHAMGSNNGLPGDIKEIAITILKSLPEEVRFKVLMGL